MQMKPWTKTTLVAAAGGAISALMAALADPAGFSVKYKLGEGRLALMMLQGAAVAVVALFMRSPQGQEIMSSLKHSQQQAKDDAAMLDKVKSDITSGATPVAPPTGPPPPNR
jgi:hypothetical protein